MIHLAGPVVLAAALAGAGVYGLLARRNAVLVLIGAELMLNAVNVLLVTANSLPSGGLAVLRGGGVQAGDGAAALDPLLPGQVLSIVVITIAAAEIGLALAVVLLVYRRRSTSDLTQLRELGEASPTYEENPDDGELADVLDLPETPDTTGTPPPADPAHPGPDDASDGPSQRVAAEGVTP